MHKKRKIDEENREFNQKWTFDYFFIKNHDKAFCLICNEVISVFKEFNLRRHYDTKHKIEFDQFKCQFRQNKVDSLKKSLEAQQNVFKKCKDQNSSCIGYRMACRNVGQLITKQTAVFLCDLQEKFRPSIQHFDAIVTVSSRLLKAAKILEVFVLYCLLFKLFIFGFLDPSSRYGTVSKRPRFNSQRAWPRAVSRDQAGRDRKSVV